MDSQLLVARAGNDCRPVHNGRSLISVRSLAAEDHAERMARLFGVSPLDDGNAGHDGDQLANGSVAAWPLCEPRRTGPLLHGLQSVQHALASLCGSDHESAVGCFLAGPGRCRQTGRGLSQECSHDRDGRTSGTGGNVAHRGTFDTDYLGGSMVGSRPIPALACGGRDAISVCCPRQPARNDIE